MINSLSKALAAFLPAIRIITPWVIGIIARQPTLGSLMAFGAYLLVVSFPVLPLRYSLLFLLRGLV
ncbi:hypothetical protein [Morganella psychrotolerans]|uniref:hypothetical protein n=1 Tax=Morganella psychrotolerans TaxID=368603 RepID=UPI0039B0B4CC